jgi:ABC-type dipeptide/oligopeptide/nickel transport system permease subunit
MTTTAWIIFWPIWAIVVTALSVALIHEYPKAIKRIREGAAKRREAKL